MYEFPQAGILAHNKLKKVLKSHGYTHVTHTPGLCRNHTCPIEFALVVDDFGVKHVGGKHTRHLRDILAANYEGIHKDWTGKKICGITLKWDYTRRTRELSIPGYILVVLYLFHHLLPSHPAQNSRHINMCHKISKHPTQQHQLPTTKHHPFHQLVLPEHK